MLSAIERLVMDATEVRVVPSKREQVRTRIKAGQCLVCGTVGTLRRGLCVPHYHQYRRKLLTKSKAGKLEMERRAIRTGLILDVQAVRAIRRDDPFADL